MLRIINFHLIDDAGWFERVICHLKSRYSIVNTDDVLSYYQGREIPAKACHLTVDDGDKTFYDVVFPVLKRHGIPASLFVSPKICIEEKNYWFQEIGGFDKDILLKVLAEMLVVPNEALFKYDIASIFKVLPIEKILNVIYTYQRATSTTAKPFRNMTITELREVDQSGLITVGAHTMNHPILSNEDDLSSWSEIKNSIYGLAELLGHRVEYFAYPNGIYGLDFSEREEKYILDCGVKLAFTTEARNLSIKDIGTRVPRIGVSNAENMVLLRTKLFAGSFWDSLKKHKVTGEYNQRLELREMLSGEINAV